VGRRFGSCRQQLARADELRESSQQSLDALKQQFEALTADLQPVHTAALGRSYASAAAASPPPAARAPAVRASSPPPPLLPGGSASPAPSSTRAVDVLERCVLWPHPLCLATRSAVCWRRVRCLSPSASSRSIRLRAALRFP
jgi:hypothetical protein